MFISAGIVILFEDRFLICHPTGKKKWSIPKGLVNKNEEDIDAAIRETFEETGIEIDKNKLVDCGIFDYRAGKKLHLYLFKSNKIYEQLKCVTNNLQGLIEIDNYQWVTLKEAAFYLKSKQHLVLQKIFL